MGDKGARSVWQDDVYEKWLLKYNKDGREMDDAVERFAASCAGYCVGTCALETCCNAWVRVRNCFTSCLLDGGARRCPWYW